MAKRYTEEQKQYLKDNASIPRKQMVKDFNAKFGLNKKIRTLDCYMNKHGWTSCNPRGMQKGTIAWNKGLYGVNGNSSKTQFKKGNIPWNKGTHLYYGTTENQFKKGNVPYNANRPIGHEYSGGNDEVMINIGNNTYVKKHRYIYRLHHGELNSNEIVRFKDGDKSNFHPDNLEKFTRAENLILNLHGYSNAPLELKETIKFTAKIKAMVYEKIYNNKRG